MTNLRNCLFLVLVTLAACGDSPTKLDPSAGSKTKQDKVVAPKSLFALRNLARLHGQRESEEGFSEAALLLDQILKKHPNDVRALMDRLSAAVQIKAQSEFALALVARLKSLDVPKSQESRFAYLRGIAHKRNQEYVDAWNAFEIVLRESPDHPQARYQAGMAAEKAEKFEAAKLHFQTLVEKKQLIRPAAYRLSRVMQRLGDSEGMKAALEIFESRPNDEKPLTEASVFLRPSPAPFQPNELKIQSSPLPFSQSSQAFAIKGNKQWELLGNGHMAYIDQDGRFGVVGLDGPVFASDSSDTWTRFATCDFDNNGTNDALLFGSATVSIVTNVESSQPVPIDAQIEGWPAIKLMGNITTLDIDHDGDLDALFVSAHKEGEVALMQLKNLGNGKFNLHAVAEIPAPSGAAHYVITGNDFDSGNDIDLVVPGVGGAATILMNLRDEKWALTKLEGKPRSLMLAADFNGDGAPDLLGIGTSPGVSLFLNTNVEHDRAQALFSIEVDVNNAPGIWQTASASDIDNDGDLDCILGGAGICILRNRGRATFDVEMIEGAKKLTVGSLSIADANKNGALEILVCDAVSGDVSSFEPPTTSIGRAVTLVPDGRKDNRDGVGAIVEVFAGTIHSTRMITKRGPQHFGLGREPLDGFALRWPQGIRQAVVGDSMEVSDGNVVRVKQKQGLVASCPFLFTKGESGWRFKSDIVGIAPLDEWMPVGQKPHLDPEEFIRLDHEELAISGGIAQLAITEELREITYLDRVELYYVDHEESTLVLTDEGTRQETYGPLRYLTTEPAQILKPRSVTRKGKDVTDLVVHQDQRFLHAYENGPSQLQGWGPRHEVEITSSANARALMLVGRLAWYDSTTSYSLAQSNRTWEEPRVELQGPDGKWSTLIPSLGFPAGMDRNLIIPFPNGPLAANSKIRIVSNQRFLWDQIGFLADHQWHEVQAEAHKPLSASKLSRATLKEANLRDRGISLTRGDVEKHEQDYSWEAEPRDDFPKAKGWATSYGDVKALLTNHDDEFCILVAADAVELSFGVTPIPANHRRTWFLRVTGWAKESSYHNRTGRDIAPLPQQTMTSYPPSQSDSKAVLGQSRGRGIK